MLEDAKPKKFYSDNGQTVKCSVFLLSLVFIRVIRVLRIVRNVILRFYDAYDQVKTPRIVIVK